MPASTRRLPPVLLLVIGAAFACRGEPAPTESATPDAYLPTLMTSQFGEWSAPVLVGPVLVAPALNTPSLENSPELSRDGLSLYFASNRTGGVGSVDLYVAGRACTDHTDARCAWGDAKNLGPTVNTISIDGGPHLSRDGHWLYLISDRLGGLGSNDIWVAYRQDVHDDLAWEAPVNIGPPINSAALEAGPNFRGNEFYFHRGPAVGNTDIFVSRAIGRTFAPPVRVDEVSALNSFEQRPSTRWDGREMILSSDRQGTLGFQDIWVSTRPGNGAPWSTPHNLGAPINSTLVEQTPTITDDGTTLLFSSNRSGQFDLYMATRTRRSPD